MLLICKNVVFIDNFKMKGHLQLDLSTKIYMVISKTIFMYQLRSCSDYLRNTKAMP